MGSHDDEATGAVLQIGKNPAAASNWVELLDGHVTAAGAPSQARLDLWAVRGVTDVVTLQRGDEMASWLPERCAALDIRWHHLPLSGKRLAAVNDPISIAAIPGLLNMLRGDPARMVVHCSAGMHRTGVCLYLMARHTGLTPANALDWIDSARPLTAHELRRKTRAGILVKLAEDLFQARESSPPVL